jgi:hypothetical protein
MSRENAHGAKSFLLSYKLEVEKESVRRMALDTEDVG